MNFNMARGMMKQGLNRIIGALMLALTALMLFMPAAYGQTTHNGPLSVQVVFPGDSRSIDFSFDDDLGGSDSVHVALIAAIVPDQEIHQLVITLSPRGDVGPELGYVTTGIFMNLNTGMFNILEVLDPKFTYGFNMVRYVVNVNPYLSAGVLIASATTSFSSVDFPVAMTMTITLSP